MKAPAMTKEKTAAIEKTLAKVIDETEGEKVDIGEFVEVVGGRSFGPLLLLPTVITLLPTGALPFVPAFCGLLIMCVSLQIAWGRKSPWIPPFLSKAGLPKDKLEKSVDDKKTYIKKLDKLLTQRLKFLTTEKWQRATGVVISLLALLMIVIGFIPFAPDLFALPILFFALGYMARDGIFVLLGYVGVAVALGLLPWLAGQI